MIRGTWILFLRTLRDQAAALVAAAVLLGLLFGLGGYLFSTFGDLTAEAMSKVSPDLLIGLLGGTFGSVTPLETWLISLYVHPLLFVVLAAIVVATSTGPLAGEIGDGTLDLLLSCPVPRSAVVVSTFAVTQLQVAVLCVVVHLSMWAGLRTAEIVLPESWASFAWATVSVWALYSAIAAVGLLVSATASERGVAIARSLGFMVVSFFVNVLASFWNRFEWGKYASVFHYHQPQPIVENGGPVVSSLVVLLTVTAVAFVAAVLLFVRRDIRTA